MAIKHVAAVTFRDAKLEMKRSGQSDYDELGGASGFQYSGAEGEVQTFRHWGGSVEYVGSPEAGDVVVTAPWLAHLPIWKDLYAARDDGTSREIRLTTKENTLFTPSVTTTVESASGELTWVGGTPTDDQLPYGAVIVAAGGDLQVIGVNMDGDPIVDTPSQAASNVSSVKVPAVRIGPFVATCRSINGPTDTDGVLTAEITLRPTSALGAPTIV
ncbi:MAG: hypothetical protein F4Z57_08430 [Gemmatimonadetes bacterium]|nr:hypothetical protein [Gemmatimonadota bacterium]MYC71040.1 hypothetical protein [Gemmatimonadota bacterium]MYI61115.1 hypothetical protein [Gemmatimonadota bacterium]